MARITKRGLSPPTGITPQEPAAASTTQTPSFSQRAERPTQQAMAAAPSGTRASGTAPTGEQGERERERYERIRAALVWPRFETWCTSHGLLPPTPSDEAIALVAVYITFLAASGRNVAIVARALLRAREGE